MSQTIKLLRALEKTPLRMAIEPTNICNANCSFCAYKYSKRKKAVMDLETYKNIVSQIKALNCQELKFTPIIGDPFVDPTFIQKIRYAKSLNWFKVIYTYTNLIGLDPKQVDDFVTSGITALTISTCLQSRGDFNRIYGVDKFNQVMTNIGTLLESNKKHGFPIDINFSLRHDKNFDSINNSYYQKISKFTSKIGVLNDDYDNWCGLITLNDLPKGQSFRKVKNKDLPCCQFYNGFIIAPSGNVGICWVRDLDLRLKIGSIHQNNLQEICQSQKLKQLRQNWLRGKIPFPCQSCLQYTSVLEHPLIQKHMLRHILRYPFFLPIIIKSKLAKIAHKIHICKRR